jgi:hypothetical protein
MEDGGLSDDDLARLRRVARELFAHLPAEYPPAAPRIRQVQRVFYDALTTAVEPLLRAYLNTLPSHSYTDKRALVSWLNRELREELGLCLRDPATGRPALLSADVRYGGSDESRFRLEVAEGEGRRKAHTGYDLPEIKLMRARPRREPLSRRERRKDNPQER